MIFKSTPGVKVQGFLNQAYNFKRFKVKRISCLIKFSYYLQVEQGVFKNKEASGYTILQYYTV